MALSDIHPFLVRFSAKGQISIFTQKEKIQNFKFSNFIFLVMCCIFLSHTQNIRIALKITINENYNLKDRESIKSKRV